LTHPNSEFMGWLQTTYSHRQDNKRVAFKHL